jgi:outer membrane protein OmpA-like peptidoglycan-associated protein
MAKTATAQPPKTPPKSVPRRENFLLVSLFRLLLLGVGGTMAAFVGMAIAHFYPSTAQEPPLVEIALRRTQNWLTQIRQQLPQVQPAASPVAVSPAPAAPVASSPAAPTAPLSNADRTQLEQEAAAIQQRLQRIQQQLGASGQFNTQPMVATPVTPVVSTTANQALMVTLPSDTLFDKNQTSLRPEISVILDTVLADLQRYPGAAIQVAAHVDQKGTEEVDRALSFSQAKAVKLYLASKLPDAKWTAVGYGHSRPLAENTNESDRQRNRRIEITVNP